MDPGPSSSRHRPDDPDNHHRPSPTAPRILKQGTRAFPKRPNPREILNEFGPSNTRPLGAPSLSRRDLGQILAQKAISVRNALLFPQPGRPQTTPARNRPEPIPSRLKNTKPILQPWQEQDQLLEEQRRKRGRDEFGYTVGRITAGTRRVQTKTATTDEPGRVPKKTYLGPNLSLISDGQRLDDPDVDMGDSDNDGGPVELPVARKTMPRRRRTKPYQRKSIGPLPNKIHQNPPLDDSDDNTGPLRRPALKSIPRRPLSGANSKGVDTAVPAAMTGFNSELPTGRKTGPVRAARKTSVSLTPDPSSSEESASEDDASQHTDTSIGLPSSDSELESSSESESDEEDNEAASGFKREPTVKQEDGDTAMDGPWHGPAELIILDTPPKITIPLPQIDTALEEETRHKSSQCPKLVWRALEHLLLPTNRMQETRQLPFLLRNLRKGFLGRCSELGIPVGSRKGKHKSLTVYLKYEVEGGGSGSVYETSMEGWRCPLCSLHGTFALKRPLDFHLRSDHEEISVKWDLQHDDTWLLRLMLPNPPLEEAAGPLLDEATSQATNEEGPLQSPVADVQEPGGPHPGDESLFPSVTMSPPTSPSPSLSRTTFSPSLSSNRSHTRVSFTPASSSTLRSTPFKMEDEEDEDVKPFRTPSTTTGLSDRSTTFRSSTATTTGRSTTAATTLASSSSYRSSVLSTATATSTTRTATTGTPSSRRYPTPPPPDDPLGPVSRRPKFPLVSEYDGPTIYYSCRINPSNHSRRENDDEPTDNEPTVFDWLGTLPLDDYGLMDWAILDKEEEIWESDDVTDEQKVMHALWARWIFLNRQKFIANYYKGTLAFIDYYWRMIHRAAGWDALRYWLLLLMANRFLNAKEVANLLKEYEKKTNMAAWAPRF